MTSLSVKEFIERMRPKFPEAGEKLALRDDEEEGPLADFHRRSPNFVLRLLLMVQEIRRSPVEVGSLSYDLQGIVHARWLFGISPVNSS